MPTVAVVPPEPPEPPEHRSGFDWATAGVAGIAVPFLLAAINVSLLDGPWKLVYFLCIVGGAAVVWALLRHFRPHADATLGCVVTYALVAYLAFPAFEKKPILISLPMVVRGPAPVNCETLILFVTNRTKPTSLTWLPPVLEHNGFTDTMRVMLADSAMSVAMPNWIETYHPDDQIVKVTLDPIPNRGTVQGWMHVCAPRTLRRDPMNRYTITAVDADENEHRLVSTGEVEVPASKAPTGIRIDRTPR